MKLGTWCTLGEPRVALAVERSGVDWVGLDAQHGHFEAASLRETFALRRMRTVPMLVRVLSADAAGIGRVLDCGADGVIVPMIETPDQAAAVVRAARYGPRGGRSWGPLSTIGDYQPENAPPGDPLVSVMIETAAALAAVDSIAATPGVDMLFVGPFDLALALGTSVDELVADDSPASPLRAITDACRRAGTIAGAFAGSRERARVLSAFGYEWIATGTEAGLLRAGADASRPVG